MGGQDIAKTEEDFLVKINVNVFEVNNAESIGIIYIFGNLFKLITRLINIKDNFPCLYFSYKIKL